MESRMLIMMIVSLIYLCFLLATIWLMLKDIGLKPSALDAVNLLFYRDDRKFEET